VLELGTCVRLVSSLCVFPLLEVDSQSPSPRDTVLLLLRVEWGGVEGWMYSIAAGGSCGWPRRPSRMTDPFGLRNECGESNPASGRDGPNPPGGVEGAVAVALGVRPPGLTGTAGFISGVE
jgi:hypothetical protein